MSSTNQYGWILRTKELSLLIDFLRNFSIEETDKAIFQKWTLKSPSYHEQKFFKSSVELSWSLQLPGWFSFEAISRIATCKRYSIYHNNGWSDMKLFIIIQWAVEAVLPFFLLIAYTHTHTHGNNKPPGKDVLEEKERREIEPMWAECETISNAACRMCLVCINAHLKISHSPLKHFNSTKIVCFPPQLDFAMAWSDGKLCIATYMRNVLFVGNK